MLLVNLLFDLLMKQTQLLDALDEGQVNYHDHHVINGFDREDLGSAVDAFLTDMNYEFEKLLRELRKVRDSHA